MSERTALTKTTEKKGKDSLSKNPKENRSKSIDSPIEQILSLQQTLGNQAVQRLLKSGTIQAKLKIGKSSDKYEQEADRVADKVMSMPEPKQSSVNSHSSLVQKKSGCPECPEKGEVQSKPLAEQITPLVQRQVGPEEEEEPVQTKLLQRQEAEEEEEPVQTKLQRQAEEEEEPIQTKLVQRQDTEEEEELLQGKLLQRQEAEEEEEPVQTKLLQRQETEEEEEPVQTKLQRQPEEEEEEPVQAKQAPNQKSAGTSNIESSVNSLKGGGRPLSESSRAYFEPRFGADFSHVRVHTGSQAAEAAKSVNASAFTKGKDVVFGAGQYSPNTSTGKRILAHELVHVIQQKRNKTIRYITSLVGDSILQRIISHKITINTSIDPIDPKTIPSKYKGALEFVIFKVNKKNWNNLGYHAQLNNLFPLPRFIKVHNLCIMGNKNINVNTASEIHMLNRGPWRKRIPKDKVAKLYPNIKQIRSQCKGSSNTILEFKGSPSNLKLRAATLKGGIDHAKDTKCLIGRYVKSYENDIKKLPGTFRAGYSGFGSCKERLEERSKRKKRYKLFVRDMEDFTIDYDVVQRVKQGLPAPHVLSTYVKVHPNCSKVVFTSYVVPWKSIKRTCTPRSP